MLEIQKSTKNMKIALNLIILLIYWCICFLSFLDRWMMDEHNCLKKKLLYIILNWAFVNIS